MKKILITNSDLNIGGIETSLINLLQSLDYSKYNITLFLHDKKGELLKEIPSQVNVISNDLFKFKLLAKIAARFPFFLKLFFKKKYDTAIAFNGYNNFTDMVAAVSGKKTFIWVHSDYSERLKTTFNFKNQFLRMKYKYKHFDNIICVSETAKKSFKLLLHYQKNVKKCYNVIGLKKNEESNIKLEGEIIIVGMGRLVKSKGFERFVEIIKELNTKFNVTGYIIGEGPIRRELEGQIEKLDMKNKVILLGEIKNPIPLLKQADMFLVTSYLEGFGVTIIEALSENVPVIMPNLPISKELKTLSEGCIVADNNTNSLVDTVIKQIKDPIKVNFNLDEYNKKAINELNLILEEGD